MTELICELVGLKNIWVGIHFHQCFIYMHAFLCICIVCVCVCVCVFSHVQLFATPWTVAYQAFLSMEFSRQEYWRGLPSPSPVNLPNTGIKSMSPALSGGFFTTVPPGKPEYPLNSW